MSWTSVCNLQSSRIILQSFGTMWNLLQIGGVLALLHIASGTPCPSSTLDIAVNRTGLVFSTPDFPNSYPRPLSCKWLFTAADTDVIVFEIITLDIYPSIFCLKDILDIYDGDNKYAPVLQSWCGTKPAGLAYRTSSPHSLVTFQAVTTGDPRQGFQLFISSHENYIPDEGDAQYGPLHTLLLMVFAAIVAAIVCFVILIVLKERRAKLQRQKSES